MPDETTPAVNPAAAPAPSAGGCPFAGAHGAAPAAPTLHWWPERLDLSVLHRAGRGADPMGADFDYRAEVAKLDVEALRRDLVAVMTTSQDWWPADYGHYGPFFIRMAWHSAGTYRVGDGRGGSGSGMLRFAPLNSWPDNVNLDKARRLLWPLKQKYGKAVSWADLMILAGTVAIESMGLPAYGFAFGREDVWEPDTDVSWGPEQTWLADERHHGERDLADPLGATQMGLIYVNPEGPNGIPDPLAAARDIRETFRRMAMDDVETVALIAGGHTFGKAHGAADPGAHVGPEPEAADLLAQGLGWANSYGTGRGADTITSGLEGAWTTAPAQWDNGYFDVLFGYEWELTTSPAGAKQWTPVGGAGAGTVPDAHDAARTHAPMMLTTDLALRVDPAYAAISKRFHEHPDEFADAFARAWYKLTHRDLGPRSRCLGPLVPAEPQRWQDPVPAVDHPLVDAARVADLKALLLASGLTTAQLVRTAWASASTFRGTDKRGGANGARLRLAPQKDWAVNEPAELAGVLATLERVKAEFDAAQPDGTRISLADLIVLGGCAAVEQAARAGGHDVTVPFVSGRTDAAQDQTDVESFAVLEPVADGFRNHLPAGAPSRPAVQLLVDTAQRLTLTAPEMTVLVGGLRALGANVGGSAHGVLTDRPGALTNDVFVRLLDNDLRWSPSATDGVFHASERRTGAALGTGTAVDLVFGSNSQLRAIAEVYASADGAEPFVRDFVAAWHKVMQLDRFDLR